MTVHSFPPARGQRPNERVRSQIVYHLVPTQKDNGIWGPTVLGAGRFATVYKAEQRSEGQNLREVAIKVLHINATHADHELLEQEVELLKVLSASSQVHIMHTLDLIQLEPMIMCACGETYRPWCPECGKGPLRKHQPENKEHPSLLCRECNFELPGDEIRDRKRQERLLRAPAKECPKCQEGLAAREGTLINFVDRPAVVMELLEVRLDQFGHYRKRQLAEMGQQYGVEPTPEDEDFKQRALVLDKTLLMVQLAEAVAWFHSEKMELVHKDLTPDNIMIHFIGELVGKDRAKVRLPTRGQGQAKRHRDLIWELVSLPNFSVRVIDFGLADRHQPTRKWYDEEEIRKGGVGKWAYMSPEGYESVVQSQHLLDPLEVDAEQARFRVPENFLKSDGGVMEGDILAFEWDRRHDYDLTITRLERAVSGETYAYFTGTPPADREQRQFKLVHRLGVAHDIYALGALFYYVLTEEHQEVANLRVLARNLQKQRAPMDVRVLRQRPDYQECRERIPMPDREWQDRLMEIILRAMVRGHDGFGFCRDRIVEGQQPSQRLLDEIKRLCRELQQDVLAQPRRRGIFSGLRGG